MYRIGDKVRLNNRPIPGACIIGVIVGLAASASGQTTATVEDEAKGKHEAYSGDLKMEQAAPPRLLEGATIKDGDKLIACTVVRVNGNGTTIDLIADKATKKRFKSNSYEAPDKYDHEPDPFGVQYTARQRNDGKWYVKGSETATVTIGVRETANPPPAETVAA